LLDVHGEVQALAQASQEMTGEWYHVGREVQSPHEGVQLQPTQGDALGADGVARP
jgi:hypothetical protein